MAQSVYPLPISGRSTPPTLQQTLTSSTNWTIPAGIDTVYYVAVGGGGGGGSSAPQYVQYSNPTGPGYGGGSGYIMTGMISNLSARAGQTIPIVVASGGGGDTRGGHTYIDGILVAMGGKNGKSGGDYYNYNSAKGYGASGTGGANGLQVDPYGDGVGSNLITTFTYPPGGGNGTGGTGGAAGTGPSTSGNGGASNAGGNSGTRGGGGGGGGQPSPSGFQPGRGGGSGGSGVVYLYY